MQKILILLVAIVLPGLSACGGGGGGSSPTTGTVTITSSSEGAGLPDTGTYVVSVYIDGSATAAATKTIDTSVSSVSLNVDVAAGTHSFIVIFEYTDQLFGGPYQLALSNAKSDDVVAGATHTVSYISSDYSYQDFDGDGLTNLAELDNSIRTDPGDPRCVLDKSILAGCTLG
jgi:hypothetical protein